MTLFVIFPFSFDLFFLSLFSELPPPPLWLRKYPPPWISHGPSQ
jgi:hypothetical protein